MRPSLQSQLRLILLLIACLTGCGPEPGQLLTPAVYVLNHDHWTPLLVLNFAQEVAPLGAPADAIKQNAPRLEPAIEGEWRWADPSRLAFYPSRVGLVPDARLSIHLDELRLRSGYRPAELLTYRTPPLRAVKQACHWQNQGEAPLQRVFQAVLAFNYPLAGLSAEATLDGQTQLPLHVGSGSEVVVSSDPMVRPARDGNIRFHLTTPMAILQAKGENDALIGGAEAKIDGAVDCELVMARAGWDPAPEPQPLASALEAGLTDGKIAVRLNGDNLAASVTRLSAGQEATTGVQLEPPVAGTWRYGEDETAPDLVFAPAKPELLAPGTRYAIRIESTAFPKIQFAEKQLRTELPIPPMSGSLDPLTLHTDPYDPRIKRVTATLRYSYPPAKGSIESRLAVRRRVEPTKRFDDAGVETLPFELNYDGKDPLVVYLKSAPIAIAEQPSEVRVQVAAGVVAAAGGAAAGAGPVASLAIPSARDYFQFDSADTQTVIKDDGDVERVLLLNSKVALKEPDKLVNAAEAFLLPDCAEENPTRPAVCAERELTQWRSADQVDATALQAATRIPLTWQGVDDGARTLHRLSYNAPEKRQLFVRVKKGVESTDGFQLADDARFLLTLGEYQREIKILHSGALLSLSGAKKLGVAVRGLDKVRVQLQRVLPHNMHHLAGFTQGDFQKPDFKLPIEHLAETLSYDETLPTGRDMQRRYLSVDFGRFVKDKGYPPRGLFLLTVMEPKADEKADEACVPSETESDCETQTEDAERYPGEEPGDDTTNEDATADFGDRLHDQRLILVTDLGLLVKTAPDGQQDVFVMSFRTGQPVVGADIWLLGKNGAPIASGKSSAEGRVTLPAVESLKAEKAPAVYLAEKDGDLSFLPYSRKNRLLDVSRFDIDGVRDAADSLSAYLFSDRGIYRPGDTAHIGLMLRKRDWTPLPPGLPLKAVITDPSDQELESRVIAFGAEGFEELEFTTSATGKTGSYRVELFIGADGTSEKRKSLGSTTLRVEEFQPDRLAVKTEILGLSASGFLTPDGAKAQVTVRNLFGTPAEGSTAKLELNPRPWAGVVPAFPGYHFRPTGKDLPTASQNLGEATTDANGEAQFVLPLAGIAEPVFEVSLAGEGFEKGSGRSVVNVATALVSKQPYLLGQSPDGDLRFIPKGTSRTLRLLALGPDLQPKDGADLHYEVYETRYVSTLVKREDGLYAYQSVKRDEQRSSDKLSLPGGKGTLTLPASAPGEFYVAFKNPQGEELNRVDFSVAGDGNVTRGIERNAELQLTLGKTEYTAGETVEVQIVAPYHGAGLLTLEQDGVIASRWFKTTTTASTQRITLPTGTLGNAYLSVAFVRAMDSAEIYMSPLSYGVAPFSISRRAYSQDVELQVPDTLKSGTPLDVQYTVKDPTKLLIYAVDEGILQFAHYKNPQPLDFFFRKRALHTRTHQILDLILPDHALLQNRAAPGGDEDADEAAGKYKNPFARKHKPPVAFWSGIVTAQPGQHHLAIPIPDYFNGSLRVFAVAASAGKLAAPVAKAVARNPYVIQPQQPFAVAPGDEFDMGVLVANTTGEPGDKNLEVSISPTPTPSVLSPASVKLTLGPGKDGSVRFRAKALDRLGPAEIRYRVSDGRQTAEYSEELSIRPAQPLLTTLRNGVLKRDEQKAGKVAKLELQRELFPEQRQVELSVSATPAAYLRGIVEYLKTYPYGCTEQLTSQAFPAVVLGANAELGLNAADAEKLFARTLHSLQGRQKFDGSFGLWESSGPVDAFYSLYATHLLLEARERGFKVPDGIYDRALEFADKLAQQPHYQWPEHRAQAYALYLLARTGRAVAERLRAFEAELQSQWGTAGPIANPVRFYLGAAFKLQHLDAEADRHFGEFQRQWEKTGQLPWGIQSNPVDLSLYLYLLNRHFPESLDTKAPRFSQYLHELAQDLAQQRVNSFQGSWALLGLGGLWNQFGAEAQNAFSMTGLSAKATVPLETTGQTIRQALLGSNVTAAELKGDGRWNLYYQLAERGYDRKPAEEPIAQNLAITRTLTDEKGETADVLKLEDKLRVRLALHPDHPLQDLAVVMLIPGGFEVDLSEDGLGQRKSQPIADKPLWEPTYIDVQEDRIVLFGNLDSGEKYFEFRLKPLNTGSYAVPPVFAEGMYDSDVLFRGTAGRLRVEE